jgi:hypothetical protein
VHRSSKAAQNAAAECHRTSLAHLVGIIAIVRCLTSKLSEAANVPSESIAARKFFPAAIFRIFPFHHLILDPA